METLPSTMDQSVMFLHPNFTDGITTNQDTTDRQPLGAVIQSHLEAFFVVLKAKRVSFVGPWCPVPAQS